jgi:hypothetical protein
LAPWADVLYACDFAWWKRHGGAPEFRGLKISQDPAAVSMGWNVKPVRTKADDHRMRFSEPGIIGCGGNSGFQAINLAAQFGASRIVLVGFDMSTAEGEHWHGRHDGGLRNPTRTGIAQWRDRLDAAADDLAAQNVTVINAGRKSALTRYPKMSLQEAIRYA